jgi:tetratricopeptide (TPR) repeat protein
LRRALFIQHLKKAGFTACFFLFTAFSSYGGDKIWTFSEEMQKAYLLVMNLQPDLALIQLNKITAKSEELHKIYVLSLCETTDVLITEDQKKFDQLEANFKKRLDFVENLEDGPEKLFLQAELNLQRGFNLLNMGEEFNAVFAIKRAYNNTAECLKKYPDFIPIKKTSGVIQVMIGSVPEKYHWFMNLLGMHGSVVTGQNQLSELRNSKSSLNVEATILFYTIKGFINQQFPEAAKGLNDLLKEQPDNRLVLFLGVNMMIKDSQSEKVLEWIENLDKHNQGLQMYYVEYLRGEALTHKGEYAKAIVAYQKFLKGYRSQSFKKDANFKISLCYYLLNDMTQAKIYYDKAKVTGREQADPDKYAAQQLEENKFPNAKLLKIRFATDGGYYKEAQAEIQSIHPGELKLLRDQVEFSYRKARLAHKMGELPAAKLLYQQCIDLNKENPWYFAPNAALQLGYIYRDQKDFPMARKYFEMALNYRRHEYKNSIDTKARFALDQLKPAKG